MSACPWCRERLPAVEKAPNCPRCGKQLTDSSGARLRPLDLDFEKILEDADGRSLAWTKRGAIVALVLGVVALVPVVAPFAALVLILALFFWARFLVARPYLRHYGAVRRLVTRWLGRFFIVLVAAPALGASAGFVPVPGLAIVGGPVVFGGTCAIFRWYFRFHLLREHRREGVTVLEKVFLVLGAILCVVGLVLFGLFAWVILSLLPGGK